MKLGKNFSIPVCVFLISFILNLIWEYAQMPLYLHGNLLENISWVYVRATLGDAMYIIIVYFILALMYKNWIWFKERTITKYTVVIVAGLVTATLVEWHALAAGKWSYGVSMPMVPFLDVGWTPFVQLALLSVLTFEIVRFLRKKTND